MESNMKEQYSFESVCKYITGTMSEFKDLIVSKFEVLQYIEWTYSKGTTKVCKADENGKKKCCKVGISYNSKVVLTDNIAVDIWNLFENHFKDSYLPNIERITGNEEMGRYTFSAKNELRDEVLCVIQTPGEWNIPLIGISSYVGSRYKACDI